ncbi:MAG: hypothetical protein ACYS8W_17805 [Planctomycetota bacterium]|jgi:hypothetical protein
MQRFHVLYMIASAALGVLAARGIFHLYGALLRRFVVVRTPYGRAARAGCFPTMAAFVIVMYGAQVAAPFVEMFAWEKGDWVYAAVFCPVGFFPAVYVLFWWLARRIDVSNFEKGNLPEGAIRTEMRGGQAIEEQAQPDIVPVPDGAVLVVELAVFHELFLIRPPRPAAVYGFAHEEPLWKRPLRGAWIEGDNLHISGMRGRAGEGGLPPLLVITASLREGVEHEFAKRISLCKPGTVLRPGAVRIWGLDKDGALVLDAGAKRECVRPDRTPSDPVRWRGFLSAGKILVRERANVSVVSFRLFSAEEVNVLRPGAGVEDLGKNARPVALRAALPKSREAGAGYFMSP